MPLGVPAYQSLHRNFNNKVCRGGKIYQMLCVTNTGTGMGLTATSIKVGMCCLDSSANNWFLCTATTGTGTWVKINA